ncbi:NAD(P)-dependent oxidoreductase [Kitasatospora kifunensis]|uniref:Putative NADH-flavin reductase n=1 Tax=Kitasatospora kifunensis TaxID=58351 RepID=A0A7W7VUL2_KITKI|nr:NAD(P)H-binding protein [Kitasatospora kifunensis]MBB4922590.1 putative NADH-flavin reductase [Kitasatospora kifunensis]
MRITVFGAGGAVGSRVVAEALGRGHQVTAVLRDARRAGQLPAAALILTGDAADPDQVAALTAGHDLAITATRPPAGQESELPIVTEALLAGVRRSGVRLLVVGGAATLTHPDGTAVLDAPDFPDFLLPIARACARQLDVCLAETEADWTYLSPPALLEPGTRTGHYRLGADELVIGPDGSCAISMEDLAVALLDEAEQPRHRRTRFTVGY